MHLKWVDVHDIAIQLAEHYPEINPLTINFVTLRQKVLDLPVFDDDPNRCNEKILEAIQSHWLDELD